MSYKSLSVATLLLFLLGPIAGAQGVTTAGIRGIVTAGPDRAADARVTAVHRTTGFAVEVRASSGQFLLQGLEPGGPYTITARALGAVPQRQDGVFLTLGELTQIDFALQPIATTLDTVTVAASTGAYRGIHADGGTGTTITAPMLERLPTLNRDLYDFVRLVPQISTKISLSNPGLSGGGVGFRFNNFLINGVSDRTLVGNVSGAFAGAKSISLEAVQEYQVLLSPYDVRHGDFAGALVNAVTKSGTNDFRGSVFAYGRNEKLAGRNRGAGRTPYEKSQLGFSLGGPVWRDRIHFFVAPELQRFTYPAPGPYVGQPANSERLVPVSEGDLARLDAALRKHGLTAGSAGPVQNRNPLHNAFARFDAAIPEWRSRVIAWHNYSASEDVGFSRAESDVFSLASYQLTRHARIRTTAAHLHTSLLRAGGGHNELLVSRRDAATDGSGPVQQPIIKVSVPSVSGGQVTLNTGTHENAQGSGTRAMSLTVKDHLTLPLGSAHVLSVGGEVERFRIRSGSPGGTYGTWTFASLSELEAGSADRYEVRVKSEASDTPMTGTQYGAFVGDQWRASERLSLTLGIRADMLGIKGRAPYNPRVDSLFARRTDVMPPRRVELSPRAGFVWDVTGTRRHHVRGGIGVFTTRYPLGWAQAALLSHGTGGLLRCSLTSQFPPPFNPDHRNPPTSCIGTASIPADVDLLDDNLRMMRVARGSLAYDRKLPTGVVLTNEALVTRSLSDFVFVNLNLPEPVATDSRGRVMYGTIRPGGGAVSATRSTFSEVIDLRNIAGGSAYQLSTRLEKRRPTGTGGFVSYTYSRARDVQTPIRVANRGTVAWASARVFSGRHDDMRAGISSNDVPHKIVVAGTRGISSSRGRTELSFYYVGESGRPFTFISSGTSGRGDLNADGSNINDPIYVPRNAADSLEILFSGISETPGADNSAPAQKDRELAQRAAFEALIERTRCLGGQRGTILKRNSCREPWSNTTSASIRHAFPIGAREIEIQADVFNVLNLLNSDWGHRREASPALLQHVAQTAEPAGASRPVFRFNALAPRWTTVAAESVYQLQLAVRYRF